MATATGLWWTAGIPFLHQATLKTSCLMPWSVVAWCKDRLCNILQSRWFSPGCQWSQWTFECISKASNSNLIWSQSNLLYDFTTALSLHVRSKLPYKSRYPMQFIVLPVNHVSSKCVQNNRHKPTRQKIAETDVIKSKEFESEKEKNLLVGQTSIKHFSKFSFDLLLRLSCAADVHGEPTSQPCLNLPLSIHKTF